MRLSQAALCASEVQTDVVLKLVMLLQEGLSCVGTNSKY